MIKIIIESPNLKKGLTKQTMTFEGDAFDQLMRMSNNEPVKLFKNVIYRYLESEKNKVKGCDKIKIFL